MRCDQGQRLIREWTARVKVISNPNSIDNWPPHTGITHGWDGHDSIQEGVHVHYRKKVGGTDMSPVAWL